MREGDNNRDIQAQFTTSAVNSMCLLRGFIGESDKMTASFDSEIWIAAAWTEGDLTAWQLNGQTIVERLECPAPGPLDPAALSDILTTANWPNVPVFACGLAARTRQSVPSPCKELTVTRHDTSFAPLFHLSGLRQSKPMGQLDLAAVQASGFLTLNPQWDGVLCIVGGRSHWIQISADEAVSFQNFLSPQLADFLCGDIPAPGKASIDLQAMQDTLSRPEALAAQLASVQSAMTMENSDNATTAAAIWGHLLGAEFAAARPYWLGQNLALIASSTVEPIYASAFKSQFLPVTVTDSDRMTLAGFMQARRNILGAAT